MAAGTPLLDHKRTLFPMLVISENESTYIPIGMKHRL